MSCLVDIPGRLVFSEGKQRRASKGPSRWGWVLGGGEEGETEGRMYCMSEESEKKMLMDYWS